MHGIATRHQQGKNSKEKKKSDRRHVTHFAYSEKEEKSDQQLTRRSIYYIDMIAVRLNW